MTTYKKVNLNFPFVIIISVLSALFKEYFIGYSKHQLLPGMSIQCHFFNVNFIADVDKSFTRKSKVMEDRAKNRVRTCFSKVSNHSISTLDHIIKLLVRSRNEISG